MSLRLKTLATLVTECAPDGVRPFVSLDQIEGGTGQLLASGASPHVAAPRSGAASADAGDVLFGKLRPYLAKTWLVDQPVYASTELMCLRPRPHVANRWFAYLCASHPVIRWSVATSEGTKMPRTSWEKLGEFRLDELPPLATQRATADYLDRETAQIDTLIAAKRRMVALLDEQLHSYVDQAVRGSAQSSADTQSSIIGAVPVTWDVVRARRVASIFSGTTFPHDYQGRSSGDYPLYKVGDLSLPGNETYLIVCENWVSADDLARLRGRVVPPDSVVFPRVGAALLLNARRITTRPSLVDDNSRALHFAGGDARFWRYVMTLIDFGELANPGAVPTIGEEAILSMKIPAPADQVQRTIADAIDGFRDRVGKLLATSHRQIALLQERRLALVTAAVTGQFDISKVA